MISENVHSLLDRLGQIAQEVGRKAEDITLVAASKYASDSEILKAFEAGVRVFGENRHQDAEIKMRQLQSHKLSWHFIGRIQSNKIQRIFQDFEVIQSVDRHDVLRKANDFLKTLSIKRDVLLQVNISGEKTKAGFGYNEVKAFFSEKQFEDYPQLNIKGLMGMGPLSDDSSHAKESFNRFKSCFDSVQKMDANIKVLSMGMSHDFEEAIRQGSTMIRVGSRVFKGA